MNTNGLLLCLDPLAHCRGGTTTSLSHRDKLSLYIGEGRMAGQTSGRRLLNANKSALPYSRIKGKNYRQKGKLPTSPHLDYAG